MSALPHTAPGTAPVGQLVAIITARLPSHTRSGIGLSARHDCFEGHFHRLCLNSVFQPIVALAGGEIIGHEGFVRCGGDRLLSPWSLFSLAASNADPDWLVALDRLCRTLHATNYFPDAAPRQRLFLGVQAGLVTAVARDHGEVFAGILRLLGIATERVVIQLPGCLNHDAERLRAVAESFLARGFGLAFNYLGCGLDWLRNLDFAGQVLLKINPAQLPTDGSLNHLIDACHRRRISTVVKRVETAEDRARVLGTDTDFVQGFAFGEPSAGPALGQLGRLA
jgi:EAL domain-containing protein (putative c-di-GMP-specific phosphodiesterase class I)